MKVDYTDSPPLNVPEITEAPEDRATWDVADWDTASWGGVSRAWSNWTGVGTIGRVGAVEADRRHRQLLLRHHRVRAALRRGDRVRMKVSFQPLHKDAIDVLSTATLVDFSATEFSDEETWFCCTVRRDSGTVALVIAFEFKSWCDAYVTTVLIDHRALTRRLLTTVISTVFSRASRITAEIDPNNLVALQQVWRMGFKYEGYKRRAIEGVRDAVLYGLLPEDCPYLSGKPFRIVFTKAPIHPEQPGIH